MKDKQRHAENQLVIAATNWFQGSALGPTELQALPDELTIIRSRPLLQCEAEPRAQCIPRRSQGTRIQYGAVNRRACALPLAWIFILSIAFAKSGLADDSASRMREGLKQYAAEQFDEAGKSFAAATESLEKSKSDQVAVSVFDEACALHRKGDLELARDRYLKAGLSQEKAIATSAHFNLGLIGSEQARKLAGETPEKTPPEKRKEILGEIRKSIDSYRHCLELEPKHTAARRNLELLRQWTKYYTDRWREADLEKRRNETNLIQFLDYLMESQLAFEGSVKGFRSSTSPNAFAEMKRVQSELREEIPYLKDKIESELRPKETDPQSTATTAQGPKADEELERGIALLSGWADEAASKMVAAERELAKRDATAAASQQQKAADQLDQIWDAVVPFHPLLVKELAEQTQIAKRISPPSEPDEEAKSEATTITTPESDIPPQTLEVKDNEWIDLLGKQERALRKTRLMVPKAEYELEQVNIQPKPENEASNPPETNVDPAAPAAPQVDPEAIKAGYQKAIELAPKAIEEMQSAVKQIAKRDLVQAAAHAEEARQVLQEIQDAQPKTPQQEQPDQQDQNKDQQEDQNKEGKENKDPKDEKEKQDEQKTDDQKKQKQQDKKQEEDKNGKDKMSEQRPEPKVSQDRIEEALRRVREREQEKRERDRELKARVLGRVPVDKDW